MGIGEEIRARRLGGARISAQRIFTDRLSEAEAFAGKVDELRQLRTEHPDVTLDFGAARRNVLAFYLADDDTLTASLRVVPAGRRPCQLLDAVAAGAAGVAALTPGQRRDVAVGIHVTCTHVRLP
ncbi:hypothetical protein FF36_05397 [Frankia torreyi]|uniref:Uncharacterized protein n=1 Tax=Frankia torreyi TaxID=1856 RepID=A0A0D8B8U8_9ACTN|nr:hypothetical protein [Frankia sp. ACN1ag]KJE20339.1 hypothetical protein FF36_05397 [Frankia torreyi]